MATEEENTTHEFKYIPDFSEASFSDDYDVKKPIPIKVRLSTHHLESISNIAEGFQLENNIRS